MLCNIYYSLFICKLNYILFFKIIKSSELLLIVILIQPTIANNNIRETNTKVI